MKNSPSNESNQNIDSDSPNFVDPIRKVWVGLGLIFLFFFMLPVWPFSGLIIGIPTWAVFAVCISFIVSIFIAYVFLRVWKDPEDSTISSDVNDAN